MSNLDLKFPSPGPALVKFDFHMHTLDDPYDQHVYHTVYELIDRAAILNYGALSITLHQKQFQSQSALEYAAERNILLIPGVEQDIEGSHVLLINFPQEISERVRTFKELTEARAELAKSGAPDTLVVAPHPFFPSGVALQKKFWKNKAVFDAIEISGFFHKWWNPNSKAIAASRDLGLPLIGNSDTHTLEQFGTTWSEVHCEKDAISIIRSIKAGQAVVKGRSLAINEMGLIGYKVIAQGYMKWINYKKKRGYQFIP
jgi:predicted metal-dependent phosphoesterase TrpH